MFDENRGLLKKVVFIGIIRQGDSPQKRDRFKKKRGGVPVGAMLSG